MASRLDESRQGVEQSQITPRILGERRIDCRYPNFRHLLALTFPSGGSDSAYRQSIKEISDWLRRSYADRYKVSNDRRKYNKDN